MQEDERGGSKQGLFKELYKAHDKIRCIKDRIDRLYESATYISPIITNVPKSQPNPKRFEDTIIEMADLRKAGERILRQRAIFDKFVSYELSVEEETVLSMRCEKNMGWKEIASNLKLGVTSVKTIYYGVEKKADKFGLFCTEKSD